MRNTHLIFFEGLPGSGKSTMAHFIARQLKHAAICSTWYYEVNKWHPLTPFHDMTSFLQFRALAQATQFHMIFDRYLERWRSFADQLQQTGEVALADSGLFGSLTWMLFSTLMPETEFHRYLEQVHEIIAALDPCLIYLSQEDALTSLKRWLTRQGGEAEKNAIESKTASPYGKQHHLTGFDGLLHYWEDYQRLIYRAFLHFPGRKIEIDTTASNRLHSQQQAADFLDVPLTHDLSLSQKDLQRFVGSYRSLDHEEVCVVEYGNGLLSLRGPIVVWQHTRLIPMDLTTFEVESLPFVVSFVTDGQGRVKRLVMNGPEQFLHTVNHVYHLIEPAERKEIAVS
ncbi:deoxynucleoside kinase [Ktedonosporobacter rubrisoli]|uniref:deoxynucleoside kinase n=1 Tax=Ktedonosporobacter rubrisoli TaxID=2509675 RepID=UPI0013EE621F|nr:deoxynucleoside kinase [Ktedonosporobacter rubrisoli]